ncbi:MAG: phage tail sheath family protein, partial [Muribaculaceae bacterium]|nr:phage tail sheath family protein [Muribaculaceae bacterium]
TGISVNCVRKFFGKGILVWGARTLDGISNEWRYISVRRLFNYIEESIQKSTMWAVFEPNDVNTWMKIKCQISNFLTGLWRQGALVGATPDDAYFVNVGVPATMTQDDINNGRLIVQVGIAASRPAEFITLEFSHKMEQ